MKVLLVLVAIVACTYAAHTKWQGLSEEYTFEKYCSEWKKSYDGAEIEMRKEKFAENLARILKHNSEKHSWKMGVNQFTDWTEAELKAMLGYDKGMASMRERRVPPKIQKIVQTPPAEVDWRGKGILTAVKDQGHCGSCWTFASTAQVESYTALATGELPVLSEQQILDCANNSAQCGGTGGCEGGIAQLAYETLIPTGMASEWTYPYQSYFGNDFTSCRYDAKKMGAAATLSSYADVAANDYQGVQNALANHGPLAVNVDASQWHLYEEGVFTGCSMTQNIDINHVVQLVGYGTDEKTGQAYWTVRNSWSPHYGEDGFIRIFRYPTQTCGIDNSPLDGTGCKGGPSVVTVCGSCGMIYDASYPIV